ncbi:MAG: Asp-tRNA(Asn)/Glu-tRNA(Gln) amidotransferase subunit GatC [Rhodospirillales bacterium]|nr:Asp-tRNA(Asn)/Glu-tRNA(Gln) amidotransferase subunit GatC [Rhodospirillales bacterium]
MALTRDQVRAIALLARVRVPDEGLEPMAKEISGILHWIEQLNEVDTEGVEPMTSVVAMTLPMRPDAVDDGGDPAAVLKGAPEPVDGFYAVPKVVE